MGPDDIDICRVCGKSGVLGGDPDRLRAIRNGNAWNSEQCQSGDREHITCKACHEISSLGVHDCWVHASLWHKTGLAEN